jgi:hypothetical protein
MNTLNLSRLRRLIHRQWTENQRPYLLGWAGLAGLLALFFLLSSDWERNRLPQVSGRELVFGLLLWLGGALLAQAQFAELADRQRASLWLLLPASALEKLLSATFYAVLVYPGVFLLTYYGLEVLFLALLGEPKPVTGLPPEGLLNLSGPGVDDFCKAYLGIVALALLGAVRYERFAFVKTAVSLVVVAFAIIALNGWLATLYVPEGFSVSNPIPFGHQNLYQNPAFTRVELPGEFRAASYLVAFGLVPGLLWLTTYFRLRETQR